jgi:hypothetical protein
VSSVSLLSIQLAADTVMDMDKYVFGLVALAFAVLGVCMVIWPAKVVTANRDSGEEARQPTAGEILTMRIVGVALILGGLYGLYAILTGMPGAEFFPV